jgi:hypothetical protein
MKLIKSLLQKKKKRKKRGNEKKYNWKLNEQIGNTINRETSVCRLMCD